MFTILVVVDGGVLAIVFTAWTHVSHVEGHRV